MSRRRRLSGFALVALAVTLVLAFAVGPFASSSPDGLEKVAGDQQLDTGATPHALDGGPLAGYRVDGAGGGRLSTGLAGVIGVLVTLAVASGAFVLLRALRPARAASQGTAPPNPSAV